MPPQAYEIAIKRLPLSRWLDIYYLLYLYDTDMWKTIDDILKNLAELVGHWALKRAHGRRLLFKGKTLAGTAAAALMCCSPVLRLRRNIAERLQWQLQHSSKPRGGALAGTTGRFVISQPGAPLTADS